MTQARITVLTYLGEQWAAGRLVGTESTIGQYIGWGSGPDDPTKDSDDLSGPENETRTTGVVSLVLQGAASVYQVEGTIIANAPKTITNAGNFTALVNGTLIIQTSFDPVPLNEGDSITLTFTLDPS